MTIASEIADTSSAKIEAPVVFFDGVCAMCNQSVNLIIRNDKSSEIRFAPLQGATASQVLGSDEAASLNSIVFIDESGTHRRSTAICRVMFRMGGIWKLLGCLLWIVPYPLRDMGYALVARYRYRMFGKNETCRLPTADERERFLD